MVTCCHTVRLGVQNSSWIVTCCNGTGFNCWRDVCAAAVNRQARNPATSNPPILTGCLLSISIHFLKSRHPSAIHIDNLPDYEIGSCCGEEHNRPAMSAGVPHLPMWHRFFTHA